MHVGFAGSKQNSVYLEYIFSEDSDSVTRARLKCPDQHWCYSLHGLTAAQAKVLIDDDADKNNKREIYGGYLSDERLKEIELF
jgi:hypothetical protein